MKTGIGTAALTMLIVAGCASESVEESGGSIDRLQTGEHESYVVTDGFSSTDPTASGVDEWKVAMVSSPGGADIEVITGYVGRGEHRAALIEFAMPTGGGAPIARSPNPDNADRLTSLRDDQLRAMGDDILALAETLPTTDGTSARSIHWLGANVCQPLGAGKESTHRSLAQTLGGVLRSPKVKWGSAVLCGTGLLVVNFAVAAGTAGTGLAGSLPTSVAVVASCVAATTAFLTGGKSKDSYCAESSSTPTVDDSPHDGSCFYGYSRSYISDGQCMPMDNCLNGYRCSAGTWTMDRACLDRPCG